MTRIEVIISKMMRNWVAKLEDGMVEKILRRNSGCGMMSRGNPAVNVTVKIDVDDD